MSDATETIHDIHACLPQVRSKISANSQPGTPQVKYDALLLEAGLRQALVTARSLGGRGLRIAAMETTAIVPTFWSRWCHQAFVSRTTGSAESHLTYLKQVLERSGARVLITSSDANVELLRRHRAQLEQHVRIALAKEPALAVAIDKEQTLEVARQLGLAIPRSVSVEVVSDIEGALREIGLPAVLKPVQSWVGDEQYGQRLACRLVTTSEEARCAVEDLASLGGKVLCQQFLSGRREAVSFIYAQGKFYAGFAQWAKRVLPPLGGQSVLRQSIAMPADIGTQAECLVREIDLEGYSEVEFRRDSAGRPFLMEINPRLSASVELAVRAGVDFPYLLYQWANGDEIDVVKGYRTGSWMRYLRGDFATTLLALSERGRPGVSPPHRAVLDFCLTFLAPMRYDYLDWQDPLPACAAVIDFARLAVQQVGRSLSRRKGR